MQKKASETDVMNSLMRSNGFHNPELKLNEQSYKEDKKKQEIKRNEDNPPSSFKVPMKVDEVKKNMYFKRRK